MVTEVKSTKLDDGLRILARMIARAYLKDECSKHPTNGDLEDKRTEENDGNKRRI